VGDYLIPMNSEHDSVQASHLTGQALTTAQGSLFPRGTNDGGPWLLDSAFPPQFEQLTEPPNTGRSFVDYGKGTGLEESLASAPALDLTGYEFIKRNMEYKPPLYLTEGAYKFFGLRADQQYSDHHIVSVYQSWINSVPLRKEEAIAALSTIGQARQSETILSYCHWVRKWHERLSQRELVRT
jgi:hypothetical protein